VLTRRPTDGVRPGVMPRPSGPNRSRLFGGSAIPHAGPPLSLYKPPPGAAPIDPASFITAVITNGIGVVCCAVLLWLIYYRETKTIPTLMTTFSETLAMIQKDNSKSLTLAQESFERRNKALLETFSAMGREERATCQQWHEENRQDLREIKQEQKESRHYIRDLAHVAGLRKAADEAERKLDEERKRDAGRDGPGGADDAG
jgi:gas vesicle protein